MAKKKANSFVLTIAGIAAATVIGVVGVKLTPAPHVIFSLAPSAEPQATAEPEPISCVLAGTGQIVDFADPGAEEYVSLLDTDSQSLTERYALPALERMTQSDTESLIAPLQVIQRIQTLGIDPATFDIPEANWKNLYNSVITRLAPLTTAETAQAVNFTGSSLAELNDFLAANPGSTVEVISPALVMDATLVVPTGTILHGNGAVLTPGNETLDKAIVLDQAENTAVTGFVINGGCNYGVYVKNSSSFYLADLDISNVSLKGLCVMGENTGFALVNNSIHENQNGAIFLNGEISNGVIEGNRIENNSGARNLTAGLVLCSMPIEDIETAYNPFPDEMLYDILQSPHQLVVRGNTVAQNHSSGIYSESGYLNYYVENTIYKNEKEGMCLDYGSFGNYITGCEIRQNGGRNRMSDEDLEADFILDQGRMAEYVLKQADGAEYAEEAIIAGADKITLRIRIGADINPNLAVLMINGGKPQNVVLADLPTDGEGYLYECNVTEAMDELGAVYVNVCDDATNAINYVSAQVYKDADALDALVKGMMETIKSQGGEDEISWRYADDAE